MICFRGEQSWRLPSNKVKQFYFTAEDPGSPVIRVYDEAGNVIETHKHAGDFKEP
jgi:anti-sigma factor ChrR (cupin superfamily)